MLRAGTPRPGLRDGERGSTAIYVGFGLVAAFVVGAAVVITLNTFRGETAPLRDPSPSVTGSVHGIPRANEADDASAQTDLRNAMVAARVYFADQVTYVGLTPAVAAGYEPGIRYNASGTAVPGQVSIRGMSATSVVLVTRSASGSVFCFADENGTVAYGTVDAASAAQCRGAW